MGIAVQALVLPALRTNARTSSCLGSPAVWRRVKRHVARTMIVQRLSATSKPAIAISRFVALSTRIGRIHWRVTMTVSLVIPSGVVCEISGLRRLQCFESVADFDIETIGLFALHVACA